jgi:hypothetical protein
MRWNRIQFINFFAHIFVSPSFLVIDLPIVNWRVGSLFFAPFLLQKTMTAVMCPVERSRFAAEKATHPYSTKQHRHCGRVVLEQIP